MDTGQCIYCHAMLKSLCIPCQFKVQMMHSGPVDKVCDAGETGNPECKSCDYFVEIISKLTADVCEDDLVKLIMSCITESQTCDNKQRKSKSEYKTLTNAFSAFLDGQAACSSNATRRLLDTLKLNDANREDPTNGEDFSNYMEPSSPQNVSIVLPVEISNQKSIASANADKRSKSQLSAQKCSSEPKKLKRTSYSEHVKSEPQSASSSMKEINMAQFASTKTIRKRSLPEEECELEKSTNNLPSSYRKRSQDEEYKGVYSPQMNQAQYASNINTKKASVGGINELREVSTSRSRNMGENHSSTSKGKEQCQVQYGKSKSGKKRSLNDEFEESYDKHGTKGVMKNLCGGSRASYGRSSNDENRRDELDEKIDRCLERFYKERVKSSKSKSRSRSPCRDRPERIARSSRSAHEELYYPVSVAFRSKSCCNVDGDPYGDVISFNPSKKSRTCDERRSRSGDRKLIYHTDSEGQFKSVVIAMSGEDSETDSDFEINVQRKSTRCCSPVMMDKGEQASGFTDACTQYYETDGATSNIAVPFIIVEKIDSSSQPGVGAKSNKVQKRSGSPTRKPGVKQGAGGGQKSPAKPGSANKAGKRPGGKPSDASRSKISTNKQSLRQPQWQ